MSRTFRSENMVLAAQSRWFGSLALRVTAAVLSVVFYAMSVLFLVPRLGIAVNYFVIVPVIVCSLAFGTFGGVVSGALALLSNKALLVLRGFPQHMPENDIVAALSGLLIGAVLGVLSTHYRNLGREILHRREIEDRLRSAVKERTLLLREIHHRVKNNLNVIHSLIGLQIGSLHDAASVDLLNDLSRRIGSMAFVHDQLNDKPYTGTLRLHHYIPSLVRQILGSHTSGEIGCTFAVDEHLPEISLSRATSLGLVINEVVVNSLKHAFGGVENPELSVGAELRDGRIVIRIVDNGRGFDPAAVENGLGFNLVAALVRQLEGDHRFNAAAGTEFVLSMGAADPAVGVRKHRRHDDGASPD